MGEIGRMPLVSYQDARPWAKAIRDAVRSRKMPPWFADAPADARYNLLNDRRLTDAEIATLAAWADSGAAAGEARRNPEGRVWPVGWNLDLGSRVYAGEPDAVFEIPRAFEVPAKGEVEYQYFVVPTGFKEDRWVQAVEVRPGGTLGEHGVVHHVVVYIRERGSTWRPASSPGSGHSPAQLHSPTQIHNPTRSDILQVYAPGTAPEVWPDGMAKLIPAGSDLVFEIHYTPNGKRTTDRTRVGMMFAAFAGSRPEKRVLTLQMSNERFVIPPGDPNYRVTVWGSLPNDALLLGFFPHMHLRGKAFEFTRLRGDGQPETLLKVSHYDFHWQLAYRLATPVLLKKGTRLQWIAWFDNSPNNPRNPDPSAEVRYGEQSREEMMVGFFDVAVDAGVDKAAFFVR